VQAGTLSDRIALYMYDFNSMTNPGLVIPSSKQLAISVKKINIAPDPISVNVVILNYKK
jgi:hypothetical protein